MINYSNFEWYYFDLHTPDGYDVVCTIHPKPFNSIFQISIFDVFVYRNNTVLFHHFFVKNAEQKQNEDGPFVLKYDDNNFIKKSNDLIELAISDEKINLKLLFKNLLKIDKPVVNELVDKKNGESLFNWIVYAPYCDGKAHISWDDNTLELTGNGYHDYNSGAANLKQIVEKWYWGKYYFGDELFIYGEILARNGQNRKIALLVNKDSYQIEDNPLMQEKNGQIHFLVSSRKLVFEMKPKNKIDDVSFYMSKLSGFTIFVKIIEALYHLSSKYSLNFLSKLIANTRYTRSRIVGKTDENNDVSCFYEEMFL